MAAARERGEEEEEVGVEVDGGGDKDVVDSSSSLFPADDESEATPDDDSEKPPVDDADIAPAPRSRGEARLASAEAAIIRREGVFFSWRRNDGCRLLSCLGPAATRS